MGGAYMVLWVFNGSGMLNSRGVSSSGISRILHE